VEATVLLQWVVVPLFRVIRRRSHPEASDEHA
jgi:hypothetical protein